MGRRSSRRRRALVWAGPSGQRLEGGARLAGLGRPGDHDELLGDQGPVELRIDVARDVGWVPARRLVAGGDLRGEDAELWVKDASVGTTPDTGAVPCLGVIPGRGNLQSTRSQ